MAINPQVLRLIRDMQMSGGGDAFGEDEDALTSLMPLYSQGQDQDQSQPPPMFDPAMTSMSQDADLDTEQIGAGGSQTPFAVSQPGPDLASLFQSLTARQPKLTRGQQLKRTIPTLLKGFIAGGATPNIAAGGGTDMFRAAMSGLGQADADENRRLALQDRELGRGLQLFKLGEAMQNHVAAQQLRAMEGQARQEYLKAQADAHKAKAAQILDNMKRGVIVVDRKGALKLNPQTGQYEPMDFSEQAIIKEIASYTKALKQQGWSEEEVKEAVKRKYTEYRDPRPVPKPPAEIKLEEEKRVADIAGRYLRAAGGDAARAIQLAQSDVTLPDQDFAMIQTDLTKRIPKPTPPAKPNTGLIRLTTDQAAAARADRFLRDNNGDAKKAMNDAQQAGDAEAAKRIKPLVPTGPEKKNLFATAAAAGGGSATPKATTTAAPTKKTYDPRTRTIR